MEPDLEKHAGQEEEYGWHYYLQDRLIGLAGPRRGVLLAGHTWGIRHAPVIAMGYNYFGRPLLGSAGDPILSFGPGIYGKPRLELVPSRASAMRGKSSGSRALPSKEP